ncbi:hypothetical protein ES703_118115 [subsurface metagenome]
MKEGRIWVGNFIGAPNAAMMLMVEISERTTTKSGRTMPEILRNITKRKMATVIKASNKNLRISFSIDFFKKCVTADEPAIYT